MFLYRFFTEEGEYTGELLAHDKKFTEDEFIEHYNQALEKVKGSNGGVHQLSAILKHEFGYYYYYYPTYTVTVDNKECHETPLQKGHIEDRNDYDGVLFIVEPPLD